MGIFFSTFYQPTANLLFFLMDFFNTESLVLGILLLIIVIKILFLWPSIKNAHIQNKIKNISAELKKIQEKTTDKQKRAEETMALYKREGINPFFTILFLLAQIPIFIAVFFVLRDIGEQSFIYSETLYSFVKSPEFIDTNFLFINLFQSGGITLGTIVLASQVVFLWFSQKGVEAADNVKKFQRIIFGVLIVVSFFAPLVLVATVGAYWFCNNIISLIQEIVFLKKIRIKN